MPEFYKYFKENMDALNLPAPETIFGTAQSAVANATVILSYIEKFGKSVTVFELIKLGTQLEWLAGIGACSVAYYVGAVIGSIAVATGRSIAGGVTIADVIFTAHRYGLNRQWLISMLQKWPGIYDHKVIARDMYRYQAVVA
jgi:hypothetical protein